jgi:PAS domain S-box-containing protein
MDKRDELQALHEENRLLPQPSPKPERVQLTNKYSDLTLVNAALDRSELRYRSLVQATAAIVWNTPASGEFETEQPGWAEFTGQTFEELKGWGWLNAIHPDDRPHTARVWSAAVASRTIYQVEHRIRRCDGEYRHMMVRAVPILSEDGTISEWIGVHTDVSAQMRAKEAAEAATRAKSEFLPT